MDQVTTEDGRIDCRTVEKVESGTGKRYLHPNAKVVGDCYEGCCDDYECPDCGTTWRLRGGDGSDY